ncbi:MAG: VOC family protein [Nitrososphaerales archaeon]
MTKHTLVDHLAFKVDDVDEAVAFLKEKDYPPVFGPETFGDWRVAYIEDPDGIWIELVRDTPAHEFA